MKKTILTFLMAVCICMTLPMRAEACSMLMASPEAEEAWFTELEKECKSGNGEWLDAATMQTMSCDNRYSHESTGYYIPPCHDYCACPKAECWDADTKKCVPYGKWKSKKKAQSHE